MTNWKIWTGLVAVFLSGLIIGAAGMQMYMSNKISRAFHAKRPFVRVLLLKKLTKGLELTSEQREQIGEIADRTADQLIELRRKQVPVVDAILDKAVSEMKQHLSQDQQKLLEARLRDYKLKRARSFDEKNRFLNKKE